MRRALLDRPRLRAALPWVLALAGGAVWGLQFGRQAPLLAPWVALAPLFLLLGQRRLFRLGFLHGLATWLVAIPWIAPTLHTYGHLHPALALAGLLILTSALAAFHGAFAALGGPLWRRGGVLLLALPALWVALEWLRTHLATGFPWNLAAYAWVRQPGALTLTSWVGAYGLSLLVVGANLGVARAVARRRWQPLAAALLIPLLVLALGARFARATPVYSTVAGGLPELRPVRLVQPDTENLVEYDPQRVAQDYVRLLRLSHQACDESGALLVWPESAAWPFTYGADPQLDRDLAALAADGCPVLFNSPRAVPPTAPGGEVSWYNSAFLVTGSGPAAYADKRHLVPWGEYVPFAGLLPFYDSIARHAGDFTAARQPHLLRLGSDRLGVAVCYEVIFPGEVAQLVQAGATVLATLTNDAWYGDTAAPWQHFRAARFRAAENRRPLLRAAVTGVSGLIAADGSVVGQLGVGEEGVVRGRVLGRSDLSPYSRRPWLVPALSTLLALSAILITWWRRRDALPTASRDDRQPTHQA